MGLSLKLLTDLAQGKLTVKDGLNSMVLPSMRQSNKKTLILKVKRINDNQIDSKDLKDSDFNIIEQYWEKDFDEHMSTIKDTMEALQDRVKELEHENEYLVTQKLEPLKKEHEKIIKLYNKKVR